VKVLVTGANGFIGRALCVDLARRGHDVIAAVRRPESARGIACARAVVVGPIGPATDWREALSGVAAVVHAAAMAHAAASESSRQHKFGGGDSPAAASESSRQHKFGGGDSPAAATDAAEIFAVNGEATRALAEAAARSGARRFVFLGTVKVLGETTEGRAPFTESDPPRPDPTDAYARAKAAAEAARAALGAPRRVGVGVLRLPLVYGPGVKANFAALARLVRRAPPLPFGRVANRRSLLFVGNLADAVALVLAHPQAANQTFVLRDGEDVSTPELIRKMAGHLGVPTRLFPFPPGLLRLAAGILGQGARAARLLDSLELDDRKIRARLGWRPPFTLDQGLALALRAPGPSDPRQGSPPA
jgi:UDP-glucose 4-epimerase